MKSTDKPASIIVPFAASGDKNTIPVSSQRSITPGAASYMDGFPPLTRTLRAAGGLPPSGLDMNGILYELSNAILWQQAQGVPSWDGSFAIKNGYPLGAVVMYDGQLYQSLADDNKETPYGNSAWKSVLGGLSSVVDVSANKTLVPADANKVYRLSGGYQLTLPSLASCSDGQVFEFINDTSYIANIVCASGDIFSNSYESISLGLHDTLRIVAAKSLGSWLLVGGTVANAFGSAPPMSSISTSGVQIGASYSNSLALTFTPPRNGYVMVFGKINLSKTASSSIGCALLVNGTTISGDSTLISQSHFGTYQVVGGVQSIISLSVSSGQTSPAVAATYQVAYLFIPGV